jgi:hypothetical protein
MCSALPPVDSRNEGVAGSSAAVGFKSSQGFLDCLSASALYQV